MRRLPLSLAVAILSAFVTAQADTPKAARPNFLLIIADDCTWSDMEIHGGQGKTPNLKKLAAQGMQFDQCFQAAPMCSPTRHALYTGLYPVKSGAWPNHTMAYDWVKSVAHYLQSAGYRTHLSGKTHIRPKKVFPFEYSKLGGKKPVAVDRFLGECASEDTPFMVIAASNEPHSPWNKGDASAYPPAEIDLPPVLADTARTRELFSAYLAEVTYFDEQVGALLALLDKHKLTENTLVVVLSEQGNAFPFAKWTCYDAGLRSAMLTRWPGRIEAGSRSSALVEYVDVVPTLLAAAGLARPEILDGRSFLSVLEGKAKTHKEFVFGLQTSKGIHACKRHYGIRSVRDGRYRYILNLTPEIPFQNTVIESGNKFAWASWKAAAAEGDSNAVRLIHDYQHRPAVELFDCTQDPWNRFNLIEDPDLADVARRLRAQLDQWMKAQGDQGQATELAAKTRQGRRRNKK
ncbi:MAG: sulfatase [Planctomycetota bacterium]|nr:sulfatase [Planctomycetota bacterium]